LLFRLSLRGRSINNEFDAYLENKAKAGGFIETEKREGRRPNYFIDEQARLTKE